jgi:hypothetical protein
VAVPANPLAFVNRLFELAIWPFQAASQYSAEHLSLHEHRSLLILLYPAMLLALPLSLIICAAVLAYVFVVMPVVAVCQGIARLFPRSFPSARQCSG